MAYTDRSHFRGINYRSAERDADGSTAPLELAARALRSAEHVCVLTGAGISAESGIPTFRDSLTGVWAHHDAKELATAQAFQKSPDLVWRWYATRWRASQRAEPNAGHHALVALQSHVPHMTLLTQNVDDLHRRAGSHHTIELHGALSRARCSNGCADSIAMEDADADFAPSCARCGHHMRPDVVWFGEELSRSTLDTARSATFACDVFLSIGTSNVVEPAASLPWLAAAHGATVIVINTSMAGQRQGPSILSLQGPAGTTLSRLVALAFQGRTPRHREE